MSSALDETEAVAARGTRGKGTRRSWSRLKKRRIVEEAFRPGASVADVARIYGLNANQVFNWRRCDVAAAAKAKGKSAAPPPADLSTEPSTAFLPVGMIVHTSDEATALVAPLAAAAAAAKSLEHITTPHPVPGERAGLIEIDLTCGTRLRVDSFVDEGALRRVLSVIKTPS